MISMKIFLPPTPSKSLRSLPIKILRIGMHDQLRLQIGNPEIIPEFIAVAQVLDLFDGLALGL